MEVMLKTRFFSRWDHVCISVRLLSIGIVYHGYREIEVVFYSTLNQRQKLEEHETQEENHKRCNAEYGH